MPELNLPFLGHGGDYNPDQWLEYPDILEKDIEMLKESGCNTVSLGIFGKVTHFECGDILCVKPGSE